MNAHGRYALPDPKCNHRATVRISSHVDLLAAAKSREAMASTYCCDRRACQDDAEAWVSASTHRKSVHVIPLGGAR